MVRQSVSACLQNEYYAFVILLLYKSLHYREKFCNYWSIINVDGYLMVVMKRTVRKILGFIRQKSGKTLEEKNNNFKTKTFLFML